MFLTIGIVFGIYVLIALIFYFFQHFFFFRPEMLPSNFKFDYEYEFEEQSFDMEDGGSINSIHFKVPNSRGLIYYFKGNSRSIKGWAKFAVDFMSNGYDFFMMDYRGFGKSRGKRTEQKLYADSQQIYKYLNDLYPEKDIIIYGRSLGSGIATRIASWNNPSMLILDSPYFSFFHLIKRWGFFVPLKFLLRYQIRTDQFIKKVKCPIHILHGDRDRFIPYEHAERLQQIKPDEIKLYKIEGAHHNDLPDYDAYHLKLYDLMELADQSKAS